MNKDTLKFAEDGFEILSAKFPELGSIKSSFIKSAELLLDCFKKGDRLFICGNGGSASDAEHIAGELVKGFLLKRPLSPEKLEEYSATFKEDAPLLKNLQGGLPAISLCSNSALITAIANDQGFDYVFAQQVLALAKKGDCLLCLSTSGKSASVIMAAKLAKAIGMSVIALTGPEPNLLAEHCTETICCPGKNAGEIQDLHRPLYHELCAFIEKSFFS